MNTVILYCNPLLHVVLVGTTPNLPKVLYIFLLLSSIFKVFNIVFIKYWASIFSYPINCICVFSNARIKTIYLEPL